MKKLLLLSFFISLFFVFFFLNFTSPVQGYGFAETCTSSGTLSPGCSRFNGGSNSCVGDSFQNLGGSCTYQEFVGGPEKEGTYYRIFRCECDRDYEIWTCPNNISKWLYYYKNYSTETFENVCLQNGLTGNYSGGWNNSSCESWCRGLSTTPPTPTPVPLACPTITNTVCRATGGVNVYWSSVSGADLYQLQRNGSTVGQGWWLSFADTTAPCGVEHTYNINVSLSSGDVITCQQERNHKITCPCTSTPTTSPTAGPTSAPTAGPSPVISGSWHDYNPTETFIYRPDFLVNTPDEMKDFVFEWRELPPEKL